MSDPSDNPLLKREPRKHTEAELLVWRELSRDPTEFWKIPCDPYPYVSFRAPDGRPGIEIGLRGTF